MPCCSKPVWLFLYYKHKIYFEERWIQTWTNIGHLRHFSKYHLWCSTIIDRISISTLLHSEVLIFQHRSFPAVFCMKLCFELHYFFWGEWGQNCVVKGHEKISKCSEVSGFRGKRKQSHLEDKMEFSECKSAETVDMESLWSHFTVPLENRTEEK